MATKKVSPGHNKTLFGESAADLIAEFVRTEYSKVVETVALATGARDNAEDAVQVALLRILGRGWRPLRLGLHVAVLAVDLIYSRRGWRARVRDWTRKMFGRARVRDWTRKMFRPIRNDTEAASGPTLRDALSQLPRGQRIVSLLHYYLAYQVSDIAVVLGVPQLLVVARLRRVNSKLKDLLGEETGP